MLKPNARVYLIACSLLGATVLLLNAVPFRVPNPLLFGTYLIAAVIVSLLNLRISVGRGVLSANLLLILLSEMELSLPEVLAVGCVALVLQELRVARFKVRMSNLVYQAGSLAIGIAAAYNISPVVPVFRLNPFFPALLLASAMVLLFHYVTGASILRITVVDDAELPVGAFYKDLFGRLLPWFVAAAYLACMINATSLQTGMPAAALALPILFVIDRGYSYYLGGKEAEHLHEEEMEAVHLRTIEAIAVALEAKDDASQLHLRRVQVSAVEIGREMGLGVVELKALQAAALLHDIGKLAIPEHIMSKPGRLTAEEFEKMKIHAMVGAEILERMQLPYPVAPIVRAHHEKWDGTGYPVGLKGEEIPAGARILSAVDCLDALASDRPHRKALPLDQAMRQVVAEAGRSFDPKVVQILERRYVELDRMARDHVNRADRYRIAPAPAAENSKNPSHASSLENLAAAIRRGDFASRDRFLDSIASASKEDQLLRELSGELGSTLGLEETFGAVARCAKRIVPHDTIGIFLVREGRLSLKYIRGTHNALFTMGDFALGEGISGRVANTQKPALNADPSLEAGYRRDVPVFHSPLSTLSVPLNGHSGQVGVLSLYSAKDQAFTREHLRILQSLSLKVATSIENALRYNSAQNLATTDFLTGLPNARSLSVHLDQELARARRDHSKIAVMLCDLDGFKQVNDTFGHLTGNEVLQIVAVGLRETCRDSDYIARLGGDEFVVVMPGLNPDTFPTQASRFRTVAEEASLRACGQVMLSMSMGVALYPVDGSTAEALLEEADRRMYNVKNFHKSVRAEASANALKARATD